MVFPGSIVRIKQAMFDGRPLLYEYMQDVGHSLLPHALDEQNNTTGTSCEFIDASLATKCGKYRGAYRHTR